MKRKDVYEAASIMEKKMQEGKRWIVLEDQQLDGLLQWKPYFESALEAGKFCAENQWQKDADHMMVERLYGYHAIENLLAEMNYLKGNAQPLLVTPAAMETTLKEMGITSNTPYDPHQALIELAYGRVMMASRVLKINPLQEAESFHIVKHMHETRGLIYELGHSHELMNSYPDYDKAVTALGEYAKELQPRGFHSNAELILVCQFKNQPLVLEMDGTPANNCGLSLSTAGYIQDELSINHFCKPSNDLQLSQQFFAKFDPQKQALVVMDDQLREINLDTTLQSFAPFSFATLIDDKLIQRVVLQTRKYGGMNIEEREGKNLGGGLKA